MNDTAPSGIKSDLKPDTGSDSIEKPEEMAQPASSGSDAILEDDIRIKVDQPLRHYDKGRVRAYRTVSGGKHSGNLFAMVCDKSMTPRFSSEVKYRSIDSPDLCKFVKAGKVFWPTEQKERYCFVYEDIMGKPFIGRGDETHAFGWNAELVLSNVVSPMIDLLRNFRNKELFHGEIWPGNMFDGGAEPGHKVYLGECLSSPAASQLPVLYEPIERALADPMGRGAGDILDDLYSFGVSLAVMIRSEDPMAGVSEEKVIEHKIEKGSYTTLMGQSRLSGSVLELLRGLLYDDPAQRWTFDDLEEWLSGRRLSPKQAPQRIRATRPIIYKDEKYIRPELLAKDLHLAPDETVKLIESKEMAQWVDRAIEDRTVKARLEEANQYIATYERGGSYSSRVSVSISHALYPDSAVRYKNISFTPQGFGAYLTYCYANSENLEPFLDVLKHSFINPIIRESRTVERGVIFPQFENARGFVKQKGLNAGLERCIYTLDIEGPCLSPLLDKHYVLTLEDMMDAFEDVCESAPKTVEIFDRHVISFLSARGKNYITPYVIGMSSSEPKTKVLAQLRALATIQRGLRLGAYPAIAKWVFNNFDPVLNDFHDSDSRASFKKKIEKLVKAGDLDGISLLFDDSPKLYENDLEKFNHAVTTYQSLVEEQKAIKQRLEKGKRYGQNTGRQIASVVSMIISFLIIAVISYQIVLEGFLHG